ncbi:MAG: thioredoxin-like protein [Desulforhopalus sp.]
MGKINIEVMYKADYCLICQYMDQAVLEVVPEYSEHVDYQRVDILSGEGKKRFLELSVSLFGEEGVYKKLQIAPIPSLFINGELFFDAIPPRPMLEDAIEEVLAEKSGVQEKQ